MNYTAKSRTDIFEYKIWSYKQDSKSIHADGSAVVSKVGSKVGSEVGTRTYPVTIAIYLEDRRA